jgi:hypothetical protein
MLVFKQLFTFYKVCCSVIVMNLAKPISAEKLKLLFTKPGKAMSI